MDALIDLQDEFWKAAGETLYMVSITLLIGGAAGLLMGLVLYATRAGSLLPNKAIFVVLNVVINFFRPIPFIIFIAAVQPLSRMIIGTGIGINAVIFALSLAASFAIARIVEQNLVTVSPGVIEAARSMGAGPYRILRTIVIPEALGPLILGYTFIFVAIVDMSAVAGLI
ncbi:MAG: ABC transporter permease subunit, partial [Leifsonia flava]